MTRRDFILIAQALHKAQPDLKENTAEALARWQGWHGAVLNMADALATTNPRFDAQRFVNACRTGVM